MDVKNGLQPLFSYSVDIILPMIGISLLIIIVLIFDKFFKKKIIAYINKPNVPKLRVKYLKLLQQLYNEITNNQIDIKDAYVRLSTLVREFIEKSTGINVLSFTKYDAQKAGMKDLALLMEHYYPHEFSNQGRGEILDSVRDTMEVIKQWKDK